jgi:sortase (surface protein transpeptidase)
VSRRAAAALVAEVALGVGVLTAGLVAIASSGPDSSAAPAAPESSAPFTASTGRSPAPIPSLTQPVTTVAAAQPTATTSVATAASSTTSTTSTTTTTVPTTTTAVAPIVTHRATVDVLAPQPAAAPVRVAIPALEVDGPVLLGGVNSENELDVPPDARSLVWYRHGPAPGDRGSAVIAGHLNWQGLSGLFAELAEIPVGAEITVLFDDGGQRSFRVTTVELVPKPAVSVNGVFARGGARVLRLVTCGGEFDDEVNSYRSNVVVTAVPA